ncbi:hypothetical protein CN553_07135 [Bacillus cereus]|uniref:Uncharacterized protein n=1 Tax=Bacillus cereus TaxID=1396 RepID=A0A9X6YNT5_BACCE|nr:hypothetical protein CN553_07135 [Bacillus cereus]PES37980.1 hypothetical protein CN493_11075 [Bacillus thuringiensis]PEV24563.1 hypothetical protein CN420_18480 [Bacillus thuringiensis]
MKIKGKAFWLRKTEIHLPHIVGLCPSHAPGRRILSGNSLNAIISSNDFTGTFFAAKDNR